MWKILLIFLLIGFVSCSKKGPWKKVLIEVDEVDSILVWRKESASIDINTSRKYIKLSDIQVKKIIDNWNNAPSAGAWKYSPNFEMTVYLNKNARHFRINLNHIKEDSDVTYDLGDKEFFDKLLEIEQR